MRISFTGTRSGLSMPQAKFLFRDLSGLNMLPGITSFNHGCCVGADVDVHSIVSEFAPSKIVKWPCRSIKDQVKCEGGRYSDVCAAAMINEQKMPHPLARNKMMVNVCDVLYAAPPTMEELLRSGTWATIRYARKKKVPVIIVYPNGKVEDDSTFTG